MACYFSEQIKIKQMFWQCVPAIFSGDGRCFLLVVFWVIFGEVG